MNNPPASVRRDILMIGFDGAEILDVAGPVDMFAGADEELARQGAPAAYRTALAAPGGAPFRTSCGIVLAPDSGLEAWRGRAVDTLLVAGGPGVSGQPPDPGVIAFLRETAPRARRVASICTGAFLLAEAGLLDGRRAVTHWAHCAALARRHPMVRVENDPIFINDGPVWTSAGVTAGMDLALALVEADLGRQIALAVARRRVMFLKRPGGQSQFSAHLAAQTASSPGVARARDWVLAHLPDRLTVERLAAEAGMSPRNFARAFHRETGTTPAAFVESARVEAARRLLEETDWQLDRIALRTGFGGRDRLRRAFRRQLGVGPLDYRARFRPGDGLEQAA